MWMSKRGALGCRVKSCNQSVVFSFQIRKSFFYRLSCRSDHRGCSIYILYVQESVVRTIAVLVVDAFAITTRAKEGLCDQMVKEETFAVPFNKHQTILDLSLVDKARWYLSNSSSVRHCKIQNVVRESC